MLSTITLLVLLGILIFLMAILLLVLRTKKRISELWRSVSYNQDETKELLSSLRGEHKEFYTEILMEVRKNREDVEHFVEASDDELYDNARDIVVTAGKASASLLQRLMKIGYAKAARLIDMMEERGVVGPGEGARPRPVIMSEEELEKEE